jgi:ABC-type oligopeptide transport system substrate-binding subunit
MLIAKVKSGKIVEWNNVNNKNDELLNFQILDGWRKVIEVRADLKEYEQYSDGITNINDDHVIVEYVAVKRLTLEEFKSEKISIIKSISVAQRKEIIDNEKQENARFSLLQSDDSLKTYDDKTSAAIINIVKAFIDEARRIQIAIESAIDYDGVLESYDSGSFPTALEETQ